jgi:ArsR family transcriptional regulator
MKARQTHPPIQSTQDHSPRDRQENRQDTADCLSPATLDAQGTPSAVDTHLASLAKALGHPVRVQILRLLISRRACVCGEICDRLPLAQSTVSQHLKVLRQAGLVTVEEQGTCTCYHPNPTGLEQLQQLIGGLSQLHP